jgi:hypothetical protein
MSVTEMRMIRWMSGMTRKDRIRNEYIEGSVSIASIVDMMRKNRVQWFGHVMKQEETKALRVVIKMNVEGKKRKMKTKKEMVGYDSKLRESCWCVRRRCRKLRPVKVYDKGGWSQIVGRKAKLGATVSSTPAATSLHFYFKWKNNLCYYITSVLTLLNLSIKHDL